MKDRIAKIIEEEELTGARFAEEIGVQASSISHILSGRNNPSTDFLIKVLERFRGINAEWLLLGKGEMYKHQLTSTTETINNPVERDLFNQFIPEKSENKPVNPQTPQSIKFSDTDIDKIAIFYNDGSFQIYKNRE